MASTACRSAGEVSFHLLGPGEGRADSQEEEEMKITVDMDKCIGAGLCVVAAPMVFSQNDDDGLVIILDENPPPEQHEAVREAARLCPALVIHLQEDNG
jgi:ferredoxin